MEPERNSDSLAVVYRCMSAIFAMEEATHLLMAMIGVPFFFSSWAHVIISSVSPE